jgi:hypothetical protein
VDPTAKLHLGRYQRYLWEEKGLLVVVGGFPAVAIGKRLYEERHRIEPASAIASSELSQIMGAAVLAAMSRVERESWGWTVTLPGAERGFFCAVEPEGMVCGRVRPSSAEKAAVYLQRQKADGPLIQSQYEPLSSDPVVAISRYFKQAEQIQTRIVLDDSYSGALVQALPEGDFSQVAMLEDGKLLDLLRELAGRDELKPTHEAVVFYECRCDDAMILELITSLPDGERRELWGSESSIAVECPRCGREYTLERVQQSN